MAIDQYVDRWVSCPEKLGTPPNHRCKHYGTMIIIGAEPDRLISKEDCTLRDALLARREDCGKTCGLDTPESPLRTKYLPPAR